MDVPCISSTEMWSISMIPSYKLLQVLLLQGQLLECNTLKHYCSSLVKQFIHLMSPSCSFLNICWYELFPPNKASFAHMWDTDMMLLLFWSKISKTKLFIKHDKFVFVLMFPKHSFYIQMFH